MTVGGELENTSHWKKTYKNKKKTRENIFSLIIIPIKKNFNSKKFKQKKMTYFSECNSRVWNHIKTVMCSYSFLSPNALIQ